MFCQSTNLSLFREHGRIFREIMAFHALLVRPGARNLHARTFYRKVPSKSGRDKKAYCKNEVRISFLQYPILFLQYPISFSRHLRRCNQGTQDPQKSRTFHRPYPLRETCGPLCPGIHALPIRQSASAIRLKFSMLFLISGIDLPQLYSYSMAK